MGGTNQIGVSYGSSAAFIKDVATIADSRGAHGLDDMYRTASSTDYKSIAIIPLGCDHLSAAGTGTLEYRASDKSMRWTAVGDTAGQWVAITRGGRYKLESASVYMGIGFYILSYNTLPASDQSIAITVGTTAGIALGSNAVYPSHLWAMAKLRFSKPFKMLGLSTATTSQILECLPWLNEQTSGVGIDICRMGTNDITNSIAASTIVANATAIFDSRRAKGRKLIICGEPARWGVNTSTALTATQLQILIDINKAYRAYAESHADCIYLDLYSASLDPDYKDGRPKSGMLKDTVHDGALGEVTFGTMIYNALIAFGMKVAPFEQRGDTSNLLSAGFFSGTGGTLSTGGSGVAPDSTIVKRSTGTDLTVVSSISYCTDHQAKRANLAVAAASATSQSGSITFASTSLASLGLAVGDTFKFSCQVDALTALTGLANINAYINLTGGAITLTNAVYFMQDDNGYNWMESLPMTIPPGYTTMSVAGVIVYTNSVTNVTLGVADFVIEKVS